VSGKITTKVEEKRAGGDSKDVVRLSKGEAPGAAAGKGKPRTSAERIRALEEEAVARERALKDANERVTQLEKTIKDMQKLAELKSPGMAAAQQQAQQATASKPDAKAPAKPEPKKPEPAKPEAKKPEAMVAAKPEPAKPEAAKAGPAKPDATKPDATKPETAPSLDKPAAVAVAPDTQKPAPVAVPEAKKAPADKPAPKKAAAPAKKEPELMDQIQEAATDPLYLGVGGGILVLGVLAFVMARRRRSRHDDEPQVPPRLGKAAAAAAGAAAVTTDPSAASEPGAAAGAPGEDVDPLAEAEVYIAYGRDGQAEEILKEALAKNPKREDVQLKLLEIYAARKDKAAFGKVAGDLNKQTGGAGDTWLKAAAMGYALDSANPLYAAGKDAVAAAPAATSATDVDLDLGMGDAGTATDITLDAGAAPAGTDTGILDLGSDEKPEAGATPDFSLEVPPAGGAQTEAPLESATPASDPNVMDFQIDLPKAEEDAPTKAAPPADAGTDSGLDFKLDDLNLGEAKADAAAGGEKDGHWYDVQTKFDLAKAYQEMGDKDGAKEILQEVIKEGDAEQKAQAKNLMDTLG
jgi:pilus assembly protein FimV